MKVLIENRIQIILCPLMYKEAANQEQHLYINYLSMDIEVSTNEYRIIGEDIWISYIDLLIF